MTSLEIPSLILSLPSYQPYYWLACNMMENKFANLASG